MFSVEFTSLGVVGLGGFYVRVEEPEVVFFPVDRDLGLPASISTLGDALESRRTSLVGRAIPRVLAAGNESQVLSPVVESIPVPMVDEVSLLRAEDESVHQNSRLPRDGAGYDCACVSTALDEESPRMSAHASEVFIVDQSDESSLHRNSANHNVSNRFHPDKEALTTRRGPIDV